MRSYANFSIKIIQFIEKENICIITHPYEKIIRIVKDQDDFSLK